MSQSAKALDELRAAFAGKDSAAQEGTLNKITDLYLGGADRFSVAHIDVFDQVIGLLAGTIEVRARARLSEKLADAPNAPGGVLRKLSRDEIIVARPVLSRSTGLTEQDLVDAARHGGRDHMLAISERRDLSAPVTDMLVFKGDRVVVNAVASNPTARFSDRGYDSLIAKARQDDLLQATVGRRHDIPQRHMAVLFELAKNAARDRIQNDSVPAGRRDVTHAVNASAKDIVKEAEMRSQAYQRAVQEVSALAQDDKLNEAMLHEFARQSKHDHAVVALSYLGKMPLAMGERAILSSDNDALLIISRSIELSWTTVRALFCLRVQHRPSSRQLDVLADSYSKLSAATAQRVLRFLHARDNAVSARG